MTAAAVASVIAWELEDQPVVKVGDLEQQAIRDDGSVVLRYAGVEITVVRRPS
ncbi:hypothetical protein [Actinomycetospora flava]|uniref:Uncharacterized protein n=1 Tax=Actinomycetospora flava TaxID=3129232 RepID=A0ABU8MHJ5_9PSEU